MRDGHPALRFRSKSGDRTSLVEAGGGAEPTLRFYLGRESKCAGWLYVSAAKVSWVPSCSVDPFEVPRSDIGSIKKVVYFFVTFQAAGKTRTYLPSDENLPGKFAPSSEMADFLVRTLSDFQAGYEEFKRLTASLQPDLPQASPAPPQPKPVPLPTLVLSTQPASVQVYVDDEFKGMSSAEGRLVIRNLAPGNHRLRFTLIGYKELTESLDLTAGETKPVEVKLEAAGPKPLALAEIEEALTNGLSPKRITMLVSQYGVDFALTKEVEQRLRQKGADSDLLLAIATGKK